MTSHLPPLVTPVVATLDARTLLARVNRSIVELRIAIRHDHRDDAYWSTLATTAREAQSDRETLRKVADLLHVERAHARGRVHGRRFATLDAQRQWLDSMVHRSCSRAAALAGLPLDASLARLRAGELPAAPITHVVPISPPPISPPPSSQPPTSPPPSQPPQPPTDQVNRDRNRTIVVAATIRSISCSRVETVSCTE